MTAPRRLELLAEARRGTGEVLARGAGPEHLRFTTLLPADAYVPGLLTGTGGIRHELLRAARPDLVGSVLLWEP